MEGENSLNIECWDYRVVNDTIKKRICIAEVYFNDNEPVSWCESEVYEFSLIALENLLLDYLDALKQPVITWDGEKLYLKESI